MKFIIILAALLLASCSLFGSQTRIAFPDGIEYSSSKNLTVEYHTVEAGEIAIQIDGKTRVMQRPGETRIIVRADAASVNQQSIDALSEAAGKAAAGAVRGAVAP